MSWIRKFFSAFVVRTNNFLQKFLAIFLLSFVKPSKNGNTNLTRRWKLASLLKNFHPLSMQIACLQELRLYPCRGPSVRISGFLSPPAQRVSISRKYAEKLWGGLRTQRSSRHLLRQREPDSQYERTHLRLKFVRVWPELWMPESTNTRPTGRSSKYLKDFLSHDQIFELIDYCRKRVGILEKKRSNRT